MPRRLIVIPFTLALLLGFSACKRDPAEPEGAPPASPTALEPLPEFTFPESSVQVRRVGYTIQTLTIHEQAVQAADIRKLAALASLNVLELKQCRLDHEALALLPELRQISCLNLEQAALADQDVAIFCQMPRLKRMELAKTPITDKCIDALIQCRNLEAIDVSFTKISAAGVGRLRASLSQALIFATGIEAP